jgi:hypothetical protein
MKFNIKTYINEVKKLREEYPENFKIKELVSFFYEWCVTLDINRNSLVDEQPWMTFSAIKFLKSIVTKDMKVFEYGSGGSTIFLLKLAQKVITVEHDKYWAEKVLELVRKNDLENKHEFYTILPSEEVSQNNLNPSDFDSYISQDNSFLGFSFKDYAQSIEAYQNNYFDLVVIDGRARPSCFKHSVNKVKEGGYILLDNSERDYYHRIHIHLNNQNWVKYSLYGPGPYNSYFWGTCIWQRISGNEVILQ